MNHTQVNSTVCELELDFAEYLQYTDVRIVDLCCPPPIYHLPGMIISAVVGFIYIYIYRFIEVWQPKAGLHTDKQYIHAYNADRNKIKIGLLKIN